VSALTALPDLKRLTWHYIQCGDEQQLSDSLLLQQLTQLTELDVQHVPAAALEHLGSLTKLQNLVVNLNVEAAEDWAAEGWPGLGELKALTTLGLALRGKANPTSVCQLTALQQLCVDSTTPTTLNRLQALTALTQLHVGQLRGLSLDTAPLQLPGLQHLVLCNTELLSRAPVPVSLLASCTQLQLLEFWGVNLRGPGSLVASTMLQHLEFFDCRLGAADGAAGGPVSWQQVLPGPGRLPHLTSLELLMLQPDLQQGDMERVVACCSSLRALHLDTMQDSFASALAQLSGLTRLKLEEAGDEQCGALAQLTGLRQLTVDDPWRVSAVGLRQLAALEQLTSLGFVDMYMSAVSWPRSCSTWLSKVSPVLQEQMSDRLSDYEHAIVNQVCVGCMGGQP